MPREKKTYLDMFLDNAENNEKKKRAKRKPYFLKREEDAVIEYNNENTSQRRRGELYLEIIEPAFKEIVKGVLEMPKFHNLPKSMNRENLMEETFFRLIDKIDKFTPGMIGKNGTPVKAFSYFSTVAKNFILEKKLKQEKVLLNRADVEQSIDMTIISDDTLRKMSNYDKIDMSLDDYEMSFNSTKSLVANIIKDVITQEESKTKQDSDLIKIGYTLLYLFDKWNKIEFMKKNEFMRILTLYTGLKQQTVSLHFKKFKNAVTKHMKPLSTQKINKPTKKKEEEELDENKPTIFKYGINTMEEFEIKLLFEANEEIKGKRINNKEKNTNVGTICEDDSNG